MGGFDEDGPAAQAEDRTNLVVSLATKVASMDKYKNVEAHALVCRGVCFDECRGADYIARTAHACKRWINK